MSNIINETFTKHLRLLRQHLKPALKLNEGKMKDLAIDLEDMSDAEFKKKHGKTKSEIQALLDIEVNENDDNNILKGADTSQSTDDGYDMRRDRRPMTPSGRGRFHIGSGYINKTMYIYKVPSDKIEKAIDLGLRQTKSGKWFSPRKPNDVATKEFGSPKEWSPVDESQGSYTARDEGYDYDSDDGYDSRRDARHSRDGYVDSGPSLGPAQQKRANRIALAALDRRSVGQLYFYTVPSDKETLAIRMGLRKSKSGRWFSPGKPNDVATKEFGSPKEWSLPKE
jgi:hypothetical protein